MPKIFNNLPLKERRRKLRNNPTPQERKLWNKLKQKQLLNTKFHRQYGIGYYIVDFYAPSIKLCIECDGHEHFTRLGKEHDEKRDNYFNSLGITVLRFPNHLVDNEIENILEQIKLTILELRTPS